MIIVNSAGRRFFVRVVFRGDRYGSCDCLTHDKDDPMVEFYDRTYADQSGFGPRGQFVSRYNAKQLLEVTGGLALDYGIPDWSVDGDAMLPVVRMARELSR